MNREFFTARTVGEALAGFRPARRTAVEDVPDKITQLEETLRLTSICGLGQVALGPVLSVLGIDRGGAAAREHPKDREDTET